jgi:ligand-binding sensor domain-containing protein/two-component sensor histidine kinase
MPASMSKCFLLSCCLLFFYLYPAAQAPYRYFNKLTVQDGLSNNKVNCILQDRRGFIWIGTNDGLNRYDGKYFTIFRHQSGNTTSLSGNIITSLLQDDQEVMWIGTADGGLTKYNYKLPPLRQFKQYKHIPGDSTSIPVNIINALVQDDFGNLWLGTSGRSVLRFDKKTEKFIAPVASGAATALALCMAENEQLWVGKQGGGLLKINTINLSSKTDSRYNNLYAKLPHASVTSLFRDKKNNIWFGSWDKVLYRFNNQTTTEEVFSTAAANSFSFQNDEAVSFAEDAAGDIWIGGRNNGLQIYNQQKKEFYHYSHDPSREGTIAANTINAVFIDKKGLVWLGTDKGISICNPQQQYFEQTFLPAKNHDLIIYDFFEKSNGDVFIGTSEGLYLQKKENGSIEHHPLSYKGMPLAVTKFYRHSNGTFFIGTNYSLFSFDPATYNIALLPGTEKDSVMNKIIDSRVVSVISDSIEGRPVLLLSPYGHYLAYYDLEKKLWVSRIDTARKIVRKFNLKDNLLRKFYRTGNNQVWIATAKAGLGKWSNNPVPSVQYYDNNPNLPGSISNNNVYDMAEDAKGNLWISTYGGGLNYFNTSSGNFAHFTESNNLLEGLQTDSNGNVWMISNGNLQQYNTAASSFISYTLPDIEKSGGVKGYLYKDNAGNMYAAGAGYFIRFKPEQVKDLSLPAKMAFTDFKIFNNSFSQLLLDKNISLDYKQNYFTIEFAAPDFLAGEARYAYMLQGYNKDWVDASNINYANFSNLKSGDYIFKVRATYKKGDWGNSEVRLHISIVPPFWERWWFYLICFLVLAGAVYFAYRYRINELLNRQAIRDKIARDLHDSVGSTLSSISVYSQVAKIYNEQQKETELKNTLHKISEASGEMISEISDTVWAINPQNDNMQTILLRMESFAKPLLATADIAFHFQYDKPIEKLYLEMTARKNFYLIFKEAVNNAIKYARCKNLSVGIHYKNNLLQMKIEDDGNGFDMQQLEAQVKKSMSGNGIENMKRRAKEIKGECSIKSIRGSGTCILLQFHIT